MYFVTLPFLSLYSCCSYENATTFDGIHLNTIMYDDNEKYGKFVSKLKVLFNNHTKKNQILKVVHFGHSYSTNFNQPKHMVSLALDCKLLGWVILLSMMVPKLILVVPKSCNVVNTTIWLMLMLKMFHMEK